MKEFFYQAYRNPKKAYHGPLDTVEMAKTINLHPMKDPAYLRRAHVASLQHNIRQLSEKQLKLRDILKKTQFLIRNGLHPKPAYRRHKAKKRKQNAARKLNYRPQPWEQFDFSKIWALYENPPLRYLHYGLEVAMKNVVRFAKETLLREGRASLFHNINFGKYHTGYMRAHPTKGLAFVIDMPIKYTSRGNKSKARVTQTRRSLQLRQNFGKLRYRQITDADVSGNTLHFILPLTGRPKMFNLFLASFEKEFLIPKEAVKLLVIYFPDAASPIEQRKSFQSYANKYPSVMTWIDIKGPFMKAAALQLGTNYFSNDSLIVTCDVDVVFRREFANRCRETAVMGKRAYFPVVFSEFNPSITYAGKQRPANHFYYAKDAGIWRVFGFGLCCAHARDINQSGGFRTDLAGWGMEDVDLYDKFVNNHDVEVFRAPDPGLVHVYHPHVACARDSTEDLRAMCWAAQADRYVSAASVIDYHDMKGILDELVTNNTIPKVI